MSMMIVLDKPLPEQGDASINLNLSFHIAVGAEEARKKVHNWLVNEVSCSIGAKPPMLVVDHRPVWRVPAWLGIPRIGTEHTLGTVDVDVETGELYNLSSARTEIESQASTVSKKYEFSATYPSNTIIDDYLDPSIPLAPILELPDDEYEPSFIVDEATLSNEKIEK